MSMMGRLSQDMIIAILLLLISGGLMVASFDIREPDYGQLSPAAWPRTIVAALGFLSLLYLIQSAAAKASDLSEAGDDAKPAEGEARSPGIAGFFSYWRNVIWCFALFLGYLLALPIFGMLISGVTFAFLLMNALGGWTPKALILHGVIAVIAIGGMWALFTFGLNVPLPPGMILPRF